jgi:lysozyme
MGNNPRLSKIAAGTSAAFVICCMNFIRPHEGIVHHAYKDTGGIYTICSGHTDGVKEGDVATDEQCKEFLHSDTVNAIATVDFLTGGAKIPPETKKVFVDEVFNAGAGNFKKSTMLRLIKSGDIAGACRQFPRWVYVAGKDCRVKANNCYGIVTRREEQMNACLKGLGS